MTDPDLLTPLTALDLEGLRDLVVACLDHDGGLPAAADAAFVRRVFLGGPGVGARDAGGRLLAAVALGQPSDGVVPVSGAVHPAHRARGLGVRLLRWSIREARGVSVQLRSESVTAELERLAVRCGFTKVFGELVMRRPARRPGPRAAPGLATRPWTVDSLDAFFEAYCGSFRDRPGFPGWTRPQWVEHVTGDPAFRPDASVVVSDAHDGPIGFVLVSGPWIDQLGVVPAWRRRGIATGLLGHAIERIVARGADAVWLNVNEDNASAISLYEGLGFTRFGRRGRFDQTPSAEAHVIPPVRDLPLEA